MMFWKNKKIALILIIAILILINIVNLYFWLKNMGKLQGDMLQIDKGPLLGIPIRIGDKKQQESVVVLVKNMTFMDKMGLMEN